MSDRRALASIAHLLDEPLTVVSVGGRDLPLERWRAFDPNVRLVELQSEAAAGLLGSGGPESTGCIDYLALQPEVDALPLLRGVEGTLEQVRAVSAGAGFDPSRASPAPFAALDAFLRERGFVLWRLSDLQRDDGPLQRARALYLRGEIGDGSDREFTALARDACVASALELAELERTALARAAEICPANLRGLVAAALVDAERAAESAPSGSGRDELGALYDELGRLHLVERQTLRHRTGRVKRRIDQWRSPRLGVLRQHPPRPLEADHEEVPLPATDPPSISIVTPSLNYGEYLERTLRSVARQRYPALEHVVQDGGSTDGTADVLRRWNGTLTTWRSEPDSGQADAVNRGFGGTAGEIMAWLNADDMLLPGALARVSAHFAANPDVEMVYGHRLLVDEHDRQIGTWIMPAHDELAYLWADWVPQETLFWRRSLWERAGGALDDSYHFALDWDLLFRFGDARARMERLPHTLGAFRVHRAQKTGSPPARASQERDRLMRRVHGRTVSQEEAMRRSAPYLRRHVVAHTMHRMRSRVPGLSARRQHPR